MSVKKICSCICQCDIEKFCISTELKESEIWFLKNTFRYHLHFDYLNIFQELLKCAKKYQKALTKKDIKSIIKQLKNHKNSPIFKEYNYISAIKCTNTNNEQPGWIHYTQPRQFYVLAFDNTDLVLHLVR